jgi:hypothetical protein
MQKVKLTLFDNEFRFGEPTKFYEVKKEYYFLSNRSSTEIKEIFAKSNELTGLDFEKLFLRRNEYNRRYTLNKDEISILEENGIDFSKVLSTFFYSHMIFLDLSRDGEGGYVFKEYDSIKLFVEYVKLSDPEIILELVDGYDKLFKDSNNQKIWDEYSKLSDSETIIRLIEPYSNEYENIDVSFILWLASIYNYS